MSYASDVLGGKSSEMGDIRLYTERGSKFTRSGKDWVRCGTLYPSATYPDAATDTGLMVNGLPSTLGTAVNVSGWASNGSGTVVVAYGNSTNLLVSTDNCQTWATVAHNLGMAATDVVYNSGQTKFIAVGNSSSQIVASSSTSGASGWTLGGSASVTSAVDSTARAACDGTNVLIACSASNVACAATTTSGASLTSRSLANFDTSQVFVTVLASLGATRWLVAGGSANWSQSSTSGATAFTAVTSPAIGVTGFAAGNGVICAFFSSSGTYYTSTTGSTGSYTARGLPGIAPSANSTDNFFPPSAARNNWCTFDGTRFVTGTASVVSSNPQGVFGYSTDGIEWTTRQLTIAALSAGLVVMSANGYLATLSTTGSATTAGAQYSAAWVTTCNYVGNARPVQELASTLAAQTAQRVGYVRLSR